MDPVEVVLANRDRVTVRVGDVFVKLDADRARAEREVEAMRAAPVPTPTVRWWHPPALALDAVAGEPLGRLGEPSTAGSAAWTAVGATLRSLHDAPLPAGSGARVVDRAAELAAACERLVATGILPADVVAPNRRLAEAVLQPWAPAFVHGDLHVEHVFVAGLEVTGIIDWSEAGPGDATYDLASLTLGHPEHLDDVLAGYGVDVDRDRIRAWQSWRCLVAVPWLVDNGYGAPDTYPEVAVLRARA